MIRSSADTVASHVEEAKTELMSAISALLKHAMQHGKTAVVLIPDDYIDEIDALIAAVRADSQPAWQPIETAPKDGTRVMVLTLFPKGVGAQIPQAVTADHQSAHSGWLTVPGRYSVKPTHWMPLPPAPIGSGNQAAPENSVATDRSAAQKS